MGKDTVIKRLAGPVRHYFNSRFSAIHESVVQGNQDIGGMAEQVWTAANRVDESVHQTLSLIGRSIDELNSKIDAIVETPGERHVALAETGGTASEPPRFDADVQGALSQLGPYEAQVANFAHAHNGWSAQAGLWFNPALLVSHATGGVQLSQVNERIAEVPFVFRSLAGLPPGSRILDVGSTESSVPLSLATLGYEVTAIDPRPYPLTHPNLTAFQGFVSEFVDERPFDAVILLSSIEHFGVGAYELPREDDVDLAAMARIRELSRPATRLIMTAPFGTADVTDFERTYGPERLAALLDGWTIEEQSYLTRESRTEWRWRPSIERMEGRHVVLVNAVRAGHLS